MTCWLLELEDTSCYLTEDGEELKATTRPNKAKKFQTKDSAIEYKNRLLNNYSGYFGMSDKISRLVPREHTFQ